MCVVELTLNTNPGTQIIQLVCLLQADALGCCMLYIICGDIGLLMGGVFE